MLNMDMPTLVMVLCLFIISISVHEAAHAYSAYIFGDNTAKDEGRLTLNPLSHLDPFGTLMVLFVGFGWARPVPVDPRNLRNAEWQMPVIAAAGPISNFLLAFFSCIGLLLVGNNPDLEFMLMPLQLSVFLNLLLMVFNMVPLPPLDGGTVLRAFLPSKLQIKFDEFAPYGSFILLGLVFLPGVKDVFLNGIRTVMTYIYGGLLNFLGFFI